jgi:hypothetical protein
MNSSLVSKFTTACGEPALIRHKCNAIRQGQPITKEALQIFAVDQLSELFKKNEWVIESIKKAANPQAPNIIMSSPTGERYYVVIKTAMYPTEPLSIPKDDYADFLKICKQANAVPTFAGVSFACWSSYVSLPNEMGTGIYGGEYFISYKKLELL